MWTCGVHGDATITLAAFSSMPLVLVLKTHSRSRATALTIDRTPVVNLHGDDGHRLGDRCSLLDRSRILGQMDRRILNRDERASYKNVQGRKAGKKKK